MEELEKQVSEEEGRIANVRSDYEISLNDKKFDAATKRELKNKYDNLHRINFDTDVYIKIMHSGLSAEDKKKLNNRIQDASDKLNSARRLYLTASAVGGRKRKTQKHRKTTRKTRRRRA